MSENTRKEPQPTEHGFIVKARAHVEIRGMTEVLSFDENSVSLATTSGNMIIEGRDLRVGVLDVKEGTVAVDGHIDSIYYQDDEQGDTSRGLFGRLFH
ncbi:MAG: sporulation protein YabP [Clostridia bacterium]|nr:sporulation protein YabP [Clostridia bacterium]